MTNNITSSGTIAQMKLLNEIVLSFSFSSAEDEAMAKVWDQRQNDQLINDRNFYC